MHLVAIGGSDAGISAALRARELDPSVDVTVVVADAYPNFSICGIPYYISGEVADWHDLAHRSYADLEATGLRLRLDTEATRIDAGAHQVWLRNPDGSEEPLSYDRLVVGTGAVPVRPPIQGVAGPRALGQADGVHLLHTMGDTFSLRGTLDDQSPATALIVGAGYVGLEMAEGLTMRGLRVGQVEMLPEVLPTVDLQLGALVRDELTAQGVEVSTSTTVRSVARAPSGSSGRLAVEGSDANGRPRTYFADLVLISVGVRPDTELLVAAGAQTGVRGAVLVDEGMRTGLPDVYAAGDCVVTLHRLLGVSYLPLGTTAHKQGRVAGENAIGGHAIFAGSLGTQVVKVFDLVVARTGLRDREAASIGFKPATTQSSPDDHKAYYPTAHPLTTRVTGDTESGMLLGAQLVGRRGTEISKRVDVFATAIYNNMTVDAMSELDLSYSPPLASPWDAVQVAAQAWARDHELAQQRRALAGA
jgi:NADPH-dependent 2,4-dienoyl-CoA reductase/sulfur reductase-like enzyme